MDSFYCKLKKDGKASDDVIGIAINDHMLTVVDPKSPGGFRVVPQVAVLWFDVFTDEDTGESFIEPSKAPAPSYHSPQDIIALGLCNENEIEQFIGGDEEEIDDTPEHEGSEFIPGPNA
jgi:hypothetical protein